MLYVDLKSYLVDNCLVKVDRMSMACSLEARVPLLDKDVVELAFRVPGRLKVAGGATKVLLRGWQPVTSPATAFTDPRRASASRSSNGRGPISDR